MHTPDSTLSRFDVIPEILQQATVLHGGTLLVDGLSGMGKTFFLKELAMQARQDKQWAVTFVNADRLEYGEPFSFIERFLAAGIAPEWDFVPEAQQQPIVVARECVRRLTRSLQQSQQHQLIILDDAQWVDQESVTVLRHMIPRFNRRNVLIATGARTPHEPSSLGQFLIDTLAGPQDWHVELQPLTAENIQTLAYHRFGVTISRRNAEELQELSGGSFLGVDSIFRQVTEEEVQKLHTAWNIPIRNIELKNPLLGEYQGLSAPGMAVAQIVCLAEHELSPTVLRNTIVRLGCEDGTQVALRAGIIRESDFGQSIVPRHDLIASAVRDTVDPEFAAQVHGVLADLTTGFRSVRHLLKSAQTLTDDLRRRTDEYVAQAVELRQSANASEILRMAIQLTQNVEERQRLVSDLVLINIRAKTGYQCLDFLAEVEAMPHSILREFMAVMLRVYLLDDPFPQQRVQALLATPAHSPDDRAVQAFLMFMMVMMTMRSPDRSQILQLIPAAQALLAHGPADPTELTDQRLAWMVTPQETSLLLECYEIVQWHLNGQVDATREAIPELLERIVHLPNTPWKVDCFVPLAGAAMATGDAILAHDLAAQAVELLEQVAGEPWAAATPRIILAHTLVLFGRYEQANRVLDDLEELSHEALDLEARLTGAALRAIIDAITNGQQFEQYVGHATRASQLQWEHYGRDLPTMAVVEGARVRGDRTAIIKAATDPQLDSFANTQHGYLTFLVHALIAQGELDQARACIDRLEADEGTAWFEYWGCLDWLRARLAQAEGHHEQAAKYYAAAVLQDRFPLPHALTVLDYAGFLLESGRGSAAETQARTAVGLLQKIGATSYLPAAQRLLDRVVDQRQEAQADVLSAMTDREREIATLLAEGLSNKAIAEELVISQSTVRFHVSNILRKLQLTSRAEIPRVVDRP